MKFKIIDQVFYFIKQYPAILFSIALVVFLPFTLFFNTFLNIQSFQNTIDRHIDTQTSTIGETLALLVSADLSRPEALQANINKISESGQSIENIRIIVRDGRDYKIIAAQNLSDVGKIVNTDPAFNGESLVPYIWANGMDVAVSVRENDQKYRKLIKSLVDLSTKETYALVSFDIPLETIDRAITGNVWQVYAVLAVIVFISLFLIFRHPRLFAYVFQSKKLKELNEMKDGFIRMATHELQSPVTTIRAYIEALTDELNPIINDEQKKYFERISLSAKNLADLIYDILEVSQLQQGKMDFEPQKITVGPIVKEIVDSVRQKAEAKKITLTLKGETSPCVISANLNRFRQIVANLIENSLKYTPAGYIKISITQELARKRCVITVQDTGFGISAEGQKHLFEQFYRVKTTENSGIPGTGLGLWMSRQMAQKMNGDIMIESIERMGSRFSITFPLSDK